MWRFGRSCNNKKCFKLDFLPPRIFPKFSSLSIYISSVRKLISGLFIKSKNHSAVGPTYGCHYHRVSCSHWLSWVAFSCLRSASIIPRPFRQPDRKSHHDVVLLRCEPPRLTPLLLRVEVGKCNTPGVLYLL
jgi:hypothetical protein